MKTYKIVKIITAVLALPFAAWWTYLTLKSFAPGFYSSFGDWASGLSLLLGALSMLAFGVIFLVRIFLKRKNGSILMLVWLIVNGVLFMLNPPNIYVIPMINGYISSLSHAGFVWFMLGHFRVIFSVLLCVLGVELIIDLELGNRLKLIDAGQNR